MLDSFTANGRVPGAVILVKSPDWGCRLGTTGYANLETKTPISPDMQFRVGSVSKIFTAQTILQMEQEGKLKLTDPVLKYLDDDGIVAGIPYINEMTIGMLLQMTTGITNYLADSDIGFSPQITPQRHFDPDQLMSGLSNNGPNPPLPSDFAPGATYPNPYWATLLRERAAGAAAVSLLVLLQLELHPAGQDRREDQRPEGGAGDPALRDG